MAYRIALILFFGVGIFAGSGCSKPDPAMPEGYNKQEMMRKPPSFSASGGPPGGTSQKKKGS